MILDEDFYPIPQLNISAHNSNLFQTDNALL